MPAYASPADLIQRYDARTVGQLASDDGKPVEIAALMSNPNVLACLASASGRIEAALLQGERYSIVQLQSLTDNSLAYLKQLVCQVAFGILYERRPWPDAQQKQGALKSAEDALEVLRQGRNVFSLPGQEEAGVATLAWPSLPEQNRLPLITNDARGRFYPGRRSYRGFYDGY
jgi:phage gp36-like protein